MQFSFDLISDISQVSETAWDNQPSSLYCVVAGNISPDRTVLKHTLEKIATYDKREHPPLSRINQTKFPHASSFLSSRSKFGIVTSQLMRFSRVCTREQDFTYRARKFLSDFLKQMHSPRTTRKYVLKFLRRVPVSFPFGNAKHLVRSLFSGL